MRVYLISLLAILFIRQQSAQAHSELLEDFQQKTVLADLSLLKMLNIPVLYESSQANVGYAVITPMMQLQLQKANHAVGRCGAFEMLDEDSRLQPQEILQSLESVIQTQDSVLPFAINVQQDDNITAALTEVSPERLRENVEWFSSFPNRYNRAPEPNKFGDQFVLKLKEMLASSQVPYEIDMIAHKNTPQKSIRVRLLGNVKPHEIVVLGGHMDSINQNSYSSNMIAPGADDNASGSSNLIEALRIVIQKSQPARTVEFFWYAGEESGLLGSAEIAKAYKAEKKNVVGVLQLDMTMQPGSGEFTLGSMTDFTSATMREYLKQINSIYIGGKIVDDKCGYGCSDHASWFRQGYPAIMPFESTFNMSNHNIHTVKDLVDNKSNFNHSAMFTKIAIVMAMDLANSAVVFQ